MRMECYDIYGWKIPVLDILLGGSRENDEQTVSLEEHSPIRSD